MLCEICGEREATTKVELEGIVLRVCRNCAKFGSEVAERVERVKKRKIRESVEEDILPDFANRIREAREKKGVSRNELAAMINEKVSVIEKVEAGKMLPDEKLTKKLEKVLGIKIKGAVNHGEPRRVELPPATLGDVAEVRTKRG